MGLKSSVKTKSILVSAQHSDLFARPRRSGSGIFLCIAFAVLGPLAVRAEDIAPASTAVSYPPIREIRFVGNKTTKPQIFLQEMSVRVGDPADPAKIEQSRQAIMDLGLYKSVFAHVLEEEQGVVLEIAVKEKYYILPLPKLNRDADNNISFGAQLRMDNLGGLNQQLKLTYEKERPDNADSDRSNTRLEYVYPRMLGGDYELDANVSRTYTPTDTVINSVPTSYETQSSFAAVNLTRWFAREGPTVGWLVGSGLIWQKQVVDIYEGGPVNAGEGRGVGISVRIERQNVHDYLFSRNGTEYGYSGEFGVPFLGSDSDYTRHQIFYRVFLPIGDVEHRNLNIQFQLGMASDPLFGGKAYSLGGSKSLRGYKTGSISGNAFVLANIEFLTPLMEYKHIRGVVFTDIGNAYRSNSELNFSDPKIGVGIGLRWKLKSFVKLDLRVDYAYNVDTGDTKAYAGTKEAF